MNELQQDEYEFCVSLCDQGLASSSPTRTVQASCDAALVQSGASGISRLYIGSYFCDRLFLSLNNREILNDIRDFSASFSLPITLVVPIFPQSTYREGMRLIDTLVHDEGLPIDEVTVNDLGTANELSSACRELGIFMNWGRLLSREHRDPRYSEMSNEPRPCAMDKKRLTVMRNRFPLGNIELDPFAPVIDCSSLEPDANIALHLPHCFMSTGHICESASCGKPLSKSFRPNDACSFNCSSSFTLSRVERNDMEGSAWFSKRGRTVFFENPDCKLLGATPSRIIWTPDVLDASSHLAPTSVYQYESEGQAWE